MGPSSGRVRATLVWATAGIAVVGLTIVVGLVQPWRLLTHRTVHETIPDASSYRLLAQGAFVAHEHPTSGRVRVLDLGNGQRVVRLEDLDTTDGPALHVWLSDEPVAADETGWYVFDKGRHIDLGPLKANQGNQNYAVPSTTELAAFRSVSIWCVRFHVSFGAAALDQG